MSKVKEYFMEQAENAIKGKKVLIVGAVDKEQARFLPKCYGVEIVKTFKAATALILGDFPEGWENLPEKKRFGAHVNPIDAYDYATDNHIIPEENIVYACYLGM
jgi:hypothetical protein